jgi:hypothetical protein
MPKTELDGLPVIETDESEEITVAVKAEDIEATSPIRNSTRSPSLYGASAASMMRGSPNARC